MHICDILTPKCHRHVIDTSEISFNASLNYRLLTFVLCEASCSNVRTLQVSKACFIATDSAVKSEYLSVVISKMLDAPNILS